MIELGLTVEEHIDLDKIKPGMVIGLSVGIHDDSIHPGGLEVGEPLKTLPEVARDNELGGRSVTLEGDPDIPIVETKPRPFLDEGIRNFFNKGGLSYASFHQVVKNLLRGADYINYPARISGNWLVEAVLEAMDDYTGDDQNQEYVEQYKQDDPEKRLERTGLLKDSIDYQLLK